MVTRPGERGTDAHTGRSRWRELASEPTIAGLIVALPAFVLYWRTLMPDVGFWDTGEFQAIGPVLGIAHPTGYPSYTLLAWLASVVLQPFGNEAVRANLLSALLVAGAVGLVAAVVTRLTGRIVVGVAAGVALALSGEAWSIALRADPHAFHLFLAALILSLLVLWEERVRAVGAADRWLVVAAIVYGVALGNHALTFLLAPGIAIFVLAVQPGILRRPKLIATCVAALAVTTVAIYSYLPIRSAMNPPLDYADPQNWENFRYLVFAEQFRGDFRALPDLFDALRLIGTETFAQLGLLAILAVIGVFATAWRRPAFFFLLASWFVVNWFFALGYINADIGRYYLVPIMSAAVLGGLGAGAMIHAITALATRRGVVVRDRNRPAIVAGAVVLASVLLIGPSLLSLPARYREVDASHDRTARMWLDSVTEKLPQDAVVVSWWSYSTTLWYGMYVEHRRPDLTVIDDSTIVQQHLGDVSSVIDSYLGKRPVFLIRLTSDLPEFEGRYVLTPVAGLVGGHVYSVDGMRAATPVTPS